MPNRIFKGFRPSLHRFFLFFIVVLLLLLTPSVAAQALVNAGYLHFFQYVAESEDDSAAPKQYWNYALQLDSLNINAYRGLAHVAFREGVILDALLYLQKGLSIRPTDSRLLMLLGDIYLKSGDPKTAVETYEFINRFSDPNRLLEAYQRWGDSLIRQDPKVAQDAFEKALKIDGGSLYSLYQLSRLDNLYKEDYQQRLKKPSSSAWLVNPRLLSFDALAALYTCADELVECDLAINLVHLAIWRGESSILIGPISEFCREKSIDDSLCIRMLNEACNRTTVSDKACYWAQAATSSNNQSQELKYPSTQRQHTSANLFENAGFEEPIDVNPIVWHWSPMFSTEVNSTRGLGYFVGGRDCIFAGEGNCSLRIHGLWREVIPDLTWPRAGYSGSSVQLKANHCYRLSFLYRTSPYSEGNNAGINVGLLPSGGEIMLPETSGEWSHHSIDIQADADKKIAPIFRMWGQGSVWYDQIEMFQIECTIR